MRLPAVRGVIYFYILICVALLLFNLLYIARSGEVKRQQRKRKILWEKYLDGFAEGKVSVWNRKKLLRKLRNVQELIAFNEALENWRKISPKDAEAFLWQNRQVFLDLTEEYGKKIPMEKAFMAYVIANFYPTVGDRRDPLLEHLLGYLDNSTVYCRENVLNALYAMGNMQTVEHAFTLMSQRGWYHDARLLSDGLARFQGDREALALRLWDCRGELLECFQVGTVRFADVLPGDSFSERFLEALEEEALPLETKFAMIRYFGHHTTPQAKPMLLGALREQTGEGQKLAIAVAAALSTYSDENVRQALKEAMHSPNWYIRQNAARSLKILGFTQEEASQIEASGDRYAAEMLKYIMGYHTAGADSESEVPAAV